MADARRSIRLSFVVNEKPGDLELDHGKIERTKRSYRVELPEEITISPTVARRFKSPAIPVLITCYCERINRDSYAAALTLPPRLYNNYRNFSQKDLQQIDTSLPVGALCHSILLVATSLAHALR